MPQRPTTFCSQNINRPQPLKHTILNYDENFLAQTLHCQRCNKPKQGLSTCWIASWSDADFIWNWYQIQPIFFRVPYQKVYQLLVVWFYLNQLISQLWSFALFARSKRLCCMCARFQQSGIKVGLGFERGWGWNFMAFLTFGTSSTCERGSVAGWQMCRDTGESQDTCGWNNKQMSWRCQILSVGSFLSSCKRRSQEVESPNLSWKRIVTDANQSISSTISSPSFKFLRRVCLL